MVIIVAIKSALESFHEPFSFPFNDLSKGLGKILKVSMIKGHCKLPKVFLSLQRSF